MTPKVLAREVKYLPGDEVWVDDERVGPLDRGVCPACNGTQKLRGMDGAEYNCTAYAGDHQAGAFWSCEDGRKVFHKKKTSQPRRAVVFAVHLAAGRHSYGVRYELDLFSGDDASVHFEMRTEGSIYDTREDAAGVCAARQRELDQVDSLIDPDV